MTFKIEQYVDEVGSSPFDEWIRSFKKDRVTMARLLGRVRRFENGNLGDCKSLGEGIFENRVDFVPGYRIYFGRRGDSLIILLGGGDKSTQTRDIERAKGNWTRWKHEN